MLPEVIHLPGALVGRVLHGAAVEVVVALVGERAEVEDVGLQPVVDIIGFYPRAGQAQIVAGQGYALAQCVLLPAEKGVHSGVNEIVHPYVGVPYVRIAAGGGQPRGRVGELRGGNCGRGASPPGALQYYPHFHGGLRGFLQAYIFYNEAEGGVLYEQPLRIPGFSVDQVGVIGGLQLHVGGEVKLGGGGRRC